MPIDVVVVVLLPMVKVKVPKANLDEKLDYFAYSAEFFAFSIGRRAPCPEVSFRHLAPDTRLDDVPRSNLSNFPFSLASFARHSTKLPVGVLKR